MGYRVIYGPMPKMPKKREANVLRIQVLTAAMILVFSMSIRQLWPEGQQVLRRYLLPSEQTVTEAAFQDMMDNIREGESLGEAFTAFCKEIVSHGQQELY